MIQPFVLLELRHIERLEKLKKNLLVAQTYSRGANHLMNEDGIDVLLSDYSNPGLAAAHLNAVREDKYASIIDLKKEAHKTRLLQMLQGDKYRLYWAVVESELEIKGWLDQYYKQKMRDFISAETSWDVKGKDHVKVDGIEVIFGELFVMLNWRTEKKRIELSEIEKY